MREPNAKCSELSDEQTEWGIARDYVRSFSEIAKVVQIDALDSAIDLAWAGCALKLSALEPEMRMVWK